MGVMATAGLMEGLTGGLAGGVRGFLEGRDTAMKRNLALHAFNADKAHKDQTINQKVLDREQREKNDALDGVVDLVKAGQLDQALAVYKDARTKYPTLPEITEFSKKPGKFIGKSINDTLFIIDESSGKITTEKRVPAKVKTATPAKVKTATPEKPLKPKEIREEWDYLFGNDEEGITGLYDMEDEQVAGAMAHRAGIDLDVVKKNMAILYRYADETKYEPEVLASIRAAVLKAVEVGADPEQTEKLLKELIDAIPWRASETSGASGDF